MGEEGSGRTTAIRSVLDATGLRSLWLGEGDYRDPQFIRDRFLTPPLRSLQSFFQPTVTELPISVVVLDDLGELTDSVPWKLGWPCWSAQRQTYHQLTYLFVARSWTIARWTSAHTSMIRRFDWPVCNSAERTKLAAFLKVSEDVDVRRMAALQTYQSNDPFRFPTHCGQEYRSGVVTCSLAELTNQLGLCDYQAAHEQWWCGNVDALYWSMLASHPDRTHEERQRLRVVMPLLMQSMPKPRLKGEPRLTPSVHHAMRKQYLMELAEQCVMLGPFADVDRVWSAAEATTKGRKPSLRWKRYLSLQW